MSGATFSKTGGWSCPTCGRELMSLSDAYDCMFGDGATICTRCYTGHNGQKHHEIYEGYPTHKTCQHGFPSSGKCGQCKR